MHSHFLSGLFLLDKPQGISSNKALQKFKKLFSIKKAGHTGTLDPLATGMLPLCLGEATKYAQYLLAENKRYVVTARLGQETNTGDSEGEIMTELPYQHISEFELLSVLKKFIGSIEQVPPMYSALKYQGKPLYELARKGIMIERKARSVQMHSIILSEFKLPYFSLNVYCSKGTYIRSLIHDIGQTLGCGAHIIALRRTEVGEFKEHMMFKFEDILPRAQDNDFLNSMILPVDILVKQFPAVYLPLELLRCLQRGQKVTYKIEHHVSIVSLYDNAGAFYGLGTFENTDQLKALRLMQCTMG